MHYHFYMALCFEGEYKFNEAINELLQVKDNVKTAFIVNKYLKLALLYIKVQDITKAKEAYDYAYFLDKSMKNEMFLLVKSDLEYYAKKYHDALISYEEFFVKSTNKYKYLDRYILINLKLKRYDDAYKFYQEYVDKPGIRLSKNNKFNFYKALYELFLELGLKDKIKDVLDELNKYRKDKDEILSKSLEEKVILKLVKELNKPIHFKSLREVVRHFFNVLSEDLLMKRLAYIDNEYDITVYTHSKGLLLEKKYTNSDIEGTIIEDVFESDSTISKFETFVDYKKSDFNKVIAKSYELKDDIKTYGFILIYIDKASRNAVRLY